MVLMSRLVCSGLLLACLIYRTRASVSCYGCAGPNCLDGECTGSLCFTGPNPLGPLLGNAGIIKGCLSGQTEDTETLTEHAVIIFGLDAVTAGAVAFCDTDYCNDRGSGPRLEEHIVQYVKWKNVCQQDNPYVDTSDALDLPEDGRVGLGPGYEDDVCVGDWCWSARVRSHTAAAKDVTFRGCSSIGFGLDSETVFCISPPITDALFGSGSPLLTASGNKSVACYCAGRQMCNSPPDDIVALGKTAPLMYVSVSVEMGSGVVHLAADAYLWLFDHNPASILPAEDRHEDGWLLPPAVGYVSLHGPAGVKFSIHTQLTGAGDSYRKEILAADPDAEETLDEHKAEQKEQNKLIHDFETHDDVAEWYEEETAEAKATEESVGSEPTQEAISEEGRGGADRPTPEGLQGDPEKQSLEMSGTEVVLLVVIISVVAVVLVALAVVICIFAEINLPLKLRSS